MRCSQTGELHWYEFQVHRYRLISSWGKLHLRIKSTNPLSTSLFEWPSHVTLVSRMWLSLVCATDRSPVSILFCHSAEDCSLLLFFIPILNTVYLRIWTTDECHVLLDKNSSCDSIDKKEVMPQLLSFTPASFKSSTLESWMSLILVTILVWKAFIAYRQRFWWFIVNRNWMKIETLFSSIVFDGCNVQ